MPLGPPEPQGVGRNRAGTMMFLRQGHNHVGAKQPHLTHAQESFNAMNVEKRYPTRVGMSHGYLTHLCLLLSSFLILSSLPAGVFLVSESALPGEAEDVLEGGRSEDVTRLP